MHILMIEDEPRVADFVRRGLRTEGWMVETAQSAEDGLALLTAGKYDVVLLDVLLPGMSGEELCRHLRAIRNDVPILMLSALGSTERRITGLRNGADDYLAKPFDFDELVARIEALHRRRSGRGLAAETQHLEVGPLVFDPGSMRLTHHGVELDLSTKERDVLVVLMKNPGRVLARERLLNAVWGMEADPLTNVVDVTISRIRRKLPRGQDMIATIRNYGYRLDP
jgi:two-component system OmpR family response regulator